MKKPNFLRALMLSGYVLGFLLILQGQNHRGITLIFITYTAITMIKTKSFNNCFAQSEDKNIRVFTIYSRGLSKYIITIIAIGILVYFFLSNALIWDIIAFSLALLIGIIDLGLSVNYFHLSPSKMVLYTPSFVQPIEKGDILNISIRKSYLDLTFKKKSVPAYTIGPFVPKDLQSIEEILNKYYDKKLKS